MILDRFIKNLISVLSSWEEINWFDAPDWVHKEANVDRIRIGQNKIVRNKNSMYKVARVPPREQGTERGAILCYKRNVCRDV